ncbi:LysR family transcriptional regulator [Streptomyces sp. P6-2-1]|uniref:LysR family transcriptional regulator n=1 Tax=unclassified Streptomyces TaxID=2593676 RepID=UPI003D35FB01
MDVDLRKLRYFAAVAEHLHFGRAAEELYITQPVLSRQVKALEAELECTLLVRTTRTVELTAAGAQLHEEARRLLAAADAAVRRVRDADRGTRRLTVAFSAGLHVADALRAFAARHPEVPTDVVPAPWWEPDAPLRDGRAQAAYLRRPFDDTGLRTVPIGHERRVACLPLTHPLAAREHLTPEDIDGLVDEGRAGPPIRRTASAEEKFELLASGTRGVALVPVGVAHAYYRPDLVYLDVPGAPGVETVLATRAEARDPLLRDFLDAALTVLRPA